MTTTPATSGACAPTIDDVERRILNITAAHFNVDRATLSADSRFFQDLHADSLDMVDLSMQFEDEFNIHFPDDDADRVRTPREAAQAILRNWATAAHAPRS